MKQLHLINCSGYDGMMIRLCYYRGDVLCYGENAQGQWFILGTEKED